MDNRKIVVAGGGVLGSQIAFQSAYSGFDVTVWLRSESFIPETTRKLDNLVNVYNDCISQMASPGGRSLEIWCNGISDGDDFDDEDCREKVLSARRSIKLETDLEKAVKDAYLVIESIPENVDIKSSFFKMLAPLLPEETVVVTSSSTLLPSKFAKDSGRPELFLALHFSNSVWRNNIAEIMSHAGTSNKAFTTILEFAKAIHMVPIPVRKENKGYLLNALLMPFLFSGLDMVVKGVSDAESIDKAWTIGTKSPRGPFQIIDKVGLKPVYDVVLNYTKIPSFIAPYDFKGIAKLLKQYLDQGKKGMEFGEGFYKYE